MEMATRMAAVILIPARPRPYCNILTRRPSAATLLKVTDLTQLQQQQLRWCGGAIVASSSQQRRRNRTAALDESAEEIGGVGQAVLAALKSGVPQPNNSSRRISAESEVTDERRSAETALSGSDVLLALKRAAEVGKSKGSRKKRRRNGRRGGERVGEEDATDYNSVRPLSINRDWGVRLDDLETRLQELLQL